MHIINLLKRGSIGYNAYTSYKKVITEMPSSIYVLKFIVNMAEFENDMPYYSCINRYTLFQYELKALTQFQRVEKKPRNYAPNASSNYFHGSNGKLNE